jgi:hypothetical protein
MHQRDPGTQLADKPRRIALTYFGFALVNNQISPLPQTTFRLLPKPQFSTSKRHHRPAPGDLELAIFLALLILSCSVSSLSANMREIISLNGMSHEKSLGCQRVLPLTATSTFGARRPLQPGTRLHQPAY